MDILISAREDMLDIMKSFCSEPKTDDTKPSIFVEIVNTKTGYMCYNTLYNSLTRLSEDEYKAYICQEYIDQTLKDELIIQGLLVPKDWDELEQYKEFVDYASEKVDSKPNLTITPTMQCNARCFYCYEEGVRCGTMKVDACEKIVKFIKTLNFEEGIELTWFGGEPLLNQEWMDLFSDTLENEEIPFDAFMITNGSKLDEGIIEKIKTKWKIDSIQITLDGEAEEYFSRKAYLDEKDESVYYRVLRMIGKLARAGIVVSVRLNIDRNNQESILKAVSELADLYLTSPNIKCYPAFLQGSSEPLTEQEKIEFIKKLIDCGRGIININSYLYKIPRRMACYYNQKNAFSIDADGDIYICEQQLGKKDFSIGSINQIEKINYIERERSGQRSECLECKYLPKCQGGCQNALMNGEVPLLFSD